MIKVSVMYPNESGKGFDMEYYLNNHLSMVQEKLGDALKSGTVDKGLGGAGPGTAPTYMVMAHLFFDSVEDFQTAFGPHAESIMGDIPNFTEIQPTIQVSEVMY